MGKSLETSRKKSLDSFKEVDEINWKSQNNGQRTQEELDSLRAIRDLLENDPEISSGSSTPSSWDLTEETRKRDEERKLSQLFGGRFGGYSGIGFERFRPV